MQIKDRDIYDTKYLHICKYVANANLFISEIIKLYFLHIYMKKLYGIYGNKYANISKVVNYSYM